MREHKNCDSICCAKQKTIKWQNHWQNDTLMIDYLSTIAYTLRLKQSLSIKWDWTVHNINFDCMWVDKIGQQKFLQLQLHSKVKGMEFVIAFLTRDDLCAGLVLCIVIIQSFI